MNELERRLKAVESFVESMKRYDKIPFETDKAITRRVKRSLALQEFSVSGKGADTEDQAVDEGGAATYSVMGDPDGFLQVEINGTTYYVPYFT